MADHLLLVEDNFPLRLSLSTYLTAQGYRVTAVGSAEEAALVVDRDSPALVILDWNLPGRAGIALLSDWRASGRQLPVIMLTARDGIADRVAGLESGADDYLIKPFANEELVARIRARLRVRGAPVGTVLTLTGCRVDMARGLVSREGEEIALTTREAAVLQFLVDRAGEPVTREALMKEVWGWRARRSTRALDNAVLRVRQKIEQDPKRPRHLLTVYGSGYRFER